ncbi:hypothetical protein MKY22_15200 [Exiguobacterium sp. FSL W8-0210]|uniref:hypothetical protein n=1 Tax=unclassified Exiguobacterium TaxID=2644629 RepID=UPI001BEC1DE6|nr:hypothetical protein [Exiguobacterium sp. s168]
MKTETKERLQQAASQMKQEPLAETVAFMADFHGKVAAWLPGESVDFVHDFVTAPEADLIAPIEGDALRTKDNFEFFMRKKQTRKKLGELLTLWKSARTTETLSQIDAIGLKKWLARNEFRSEDKPWDYLNRLHVLLFLDLMTTIIDDHRLTSLHEQLVGTTPVPTSFVRRQGDVRQVIETFAEETNFTQVDIVKASLVRYL